MTDNTVELETNSTAYTEEAYTLLSDVDQFPKEFISNVFESKESLSTGSVTTLDGEHWSKGLLKRDNGDILLVFQHTRHLSRPTFRVVINEDDNERRFESISNGEPKNTPAIIGRFEKGPDGIWRPILSSDQSPNNQQL
ncbi:MAG: hypothetical protein PHP08_02090 [Candidatus Dojkabacteria bacterium]|nr:hypothetical protein [Candidatus Dojkabacteria bacterium]